MDRIVVTIRPFKLYQEVMVFHDQECIDTIEAPLDEVSSEIRKLSTKYDITKVDLAGDSIFTHQIKDELNDLTKYNRFLNIDIY